TPDQPFAASASAVNIDRNSPASDPISRVGCLTFHNLYLHRTRHSARNRGRPRNGIGPAIATGKLNRSQLRLQRAADDAATILLCPGGASTYSIQPSIISVSLAAPQRTTLLESGFTGLL